jgi:hypothetical protein
MSDIEIRQLPPDEWDRLENLEPFKTHGMPYPDRAGFVVAEDSSGQIVGYWGMVMVCHFEPLWIAPEFQRKHGLALRMWHAVKRLAEQAGILGGFAIIDDTNEVNVKEQAFKIGFQQLQAKLYVADLRGK